MTRRVGVQLHVERKLLKMDFENFVLLHDSIKLLKFEPWSTLCIIILIIISTMIGATAKILVINYVTIHAPKERPLNTLIFVDQVIQLITNFLFSTMTVLSLATATTLEDMFGYSTCVFYWILFMIHGLTYITAGLGMSFFRFMIVRYPFVTHVKIGQSRLMWLILSLGFVVSRYNSLRIY